MQCSLPHEASTTWAGGTEPWASIQLRRRRPYAVDRLAISSQSSCSFVGENFPIASQGRARIPSSRILSRRRSESRFHSDFAAGRVGGGSCVSQVLEGFVTSFAGG